MKWTALLLAGWIGFWAANIGSAADLEMVDGLGNVTGVIDVSSAGLSVFENSGDRFFYQRAPRYDLPGGRYLGFYNLELNRIIRFPRDGYGPVERADLDARVPRFVPATVSVRPIGSGPAFGPYLRTWLRQSHAGNQLFAVPLFGAPLFGAPSYGTPSLGGWSYDSGYPPPTSSPWHPQLSLGSVPMTSGRLPGFQPRSMLLESKTVPNASLPPVEVEFVNTHDDSLIVTLTDAKNPGNQPQYSLKPGESRRVKLPRDNGFTRVDVYQTTDVTGLPIEQEVRVNVPPKVRYEVVVHRMRIQSIAIDRTGKSPNVIEDVHRQGVGVGRFQLPPGDELTSGRIDVYDAAVAANNPGSVAPIITRP